MGRSGNRKHKIYSIRPNICLRSVSNMKYVLSHNRAGAWQSYTWAISEKMAKKRDIYVGPHYFFCLPQYECPWPICCSWPRPRCCSRLVLDPLYSHYCSVIISNKITYEGRVSRDNIIIPEKFLVVLVSSGRIWQWSSWVQIPVYNAWDQSCFLREGAGIPTTHT